MPATPLHLVQISDMHLFAKPHHKLLGVVTEETFQAVLTAASSLNPLPDLMLLTGDLSQDGSLASYHRLRHCLHTLPIDVYWLAGNHDRLRNMTLELKGDRIYADKLFSRGGWSFILINTLVPGKDSGYLSDETLTFLHKSLIDTAAQHQPVLLSLHHPPFQVDSAWLDTTTLQHPERLFSILDQFDHVKLVLFGHIHQEFQRIRSGVHYLSCPSTCIQFYPQSNDFKLEEIPPGFRQLWLHEDGTFTTQLQRVPEAFQSPNLHIRGY